MKSRLSPTFPSSSISRLTYYVPLLLLLCLFAQTMGHAHSASITFDEAPHLAVGYTTLRTGDLRLQPVHIHPPLANMMAAAPLLLQTDIVDPRSVGGWEIASLSAVTDALIWQYPHPRRLGLVSRFPIIGMTLLLGALVFRWAIDHFGPRAGLVALGLYAFDPNVIAHGSLVTTDIAVVLWGTAALFLTARYLRRARAGYLAGVGMTLGLALASKVSAISLLPPIGLLLLSGPRSQSWWRRFVALAGCVALAALTLWAAYGFELRPLPGFPVPVPAATHLEIYRSLQEHYELGHPSFLMGRNSNQGWWTYFPVAFLLKTPLPTLILVALSALSLLRTARTSLLCFARSPSSICYPSSTIRRWGPLVLFPLLYALSTPFSSVNIGYRHLLPILPFLFILIAPIAGRELRITSSTSRLTSYGLRFTGYALLACYLIGTLRMFPDYLPYFNLLAGGPEGGYRYLVDSNLDWGQNMWQLREWMQENGVDRVSYAHFSPDRPQVYGVRADFLPPDPRAISFAPFGPAPGVYAIGATVLQGVYTPDVNTYAWFRTHEPLARLGHALFVYDVPPRPATSWAAICIAPTPLLSPETVRERFGHPDIRIILLDCEQSWIVPAGMPGGYVLPPEVDPPPDTELEVAARLPSGKPSFSVYRLEDVAPYPEQSIATIKLEGPLAFLGYRLETRAVHSGETVLLRTFWEVREPPGRLLSLMAHLVEADGVVIAVGDGLGVGVDQLQPGDVIVQRHRLVVPEGTAAGEYGLQTGAYWLDGTERWAVHLDEGTVSDSILLESVAVLD